MDEIENQSNFDSYGLSKDRQNGRGKRGALSTPEMEFIEKNASLLDIDTIASQLGKSAISIRKYIYKKNLISKEALTKNAKAKDEAKCRDILRQREYWTQVKQQFTPDELKVFEQIWTNLWLQFNGDVLASEELQMKKYITLEIMRDRFGEQMLHCIQEIEELETKLRDEKAKTKPDKDEIRFLKMMIEKVQSQHIAISKQQRETMQEQKGVDGQLKISREDRIKNVTDATKNWTSIIKLLSDDAQVRDQVGKNIELLRIAKDASQLLLSRFHTYVDKSVDIPILSKDTVGEKTDE